VGSKEGACGAAPGSFLPASQPHPRTPAHPLASKSGSSGSERRRSRVSWLSWLAVGEGVEEGKRSSC
jgi:hypothetical protein